MTPRFVVTAWRDGDELLEVREWLYGRGEGVVDRRRDGVNKILAWKVRKPELPLLLESTADIVEAVLRDEQGGLEQHALRLLYGSAVARFVTGFADTQLDLRRSRPAWLPPSPTPFLDFPPHLLEIRHSIVHRQYPSLALLKEAAQQCLDWLWEWYWSRLDAALAYGRDGPGADVSRGEAVLGDAEVRETARGILKNYARARKTEIKTNARLAKKASQAAETAVSSLLDAASGRKSDRGAVVPDLLMDERMLVPADKRLGTSMSGAYLIWSPFLSRLSTAQPAFYHTLVQKMFDTMNAASRVGAIAIEDPLREAMHEWLLHILSSDEWSDARSRLSTRPDDGLIGVERALEHCFTAPTHWNVRLAASLIQTAEVPHVESWSALLRAVGDEGMEVDVDAVAPEDEEMEDVSQKSGREGKVKQGKLWGPQKRIGLWRQQPIGALPPGWDDEE